MISAIYLLAAGLLLWKCLQSLNRMDHATRWSIRLACGSLSVGAFAALSAVLFGWQPEWFNLMLIIGMDIKLLADGRQRARVSYGELEDATTLTG